MNRRIILATVAACLVVGALGYMVLLAPQSKTLQETKERTAAAEAQQLKLANQLRSLQAAAKTLPALEAKVGVLRAAVPDAPQLDQVIATVNDAAKGSGVELTSFAPGAPAGFGGAAKPKVGAGAGALPDVPITIGAIGTYFQVMDFMNRLNGAPRLVVIDNVSLSGQADKDKNSKVTSQLIGRMFMTGAK